MWVFMDKISIQNYFISLDQFVQNNSKTVISRYLSDIAMTIL